MRLIPIMLFLLLCESLLSQTVPIDSLQGFNSDSAAAQAALNGCSGSEQQVYIQIAKRNYIHHKFQPNSLVFTQKQYGGPLTVANAPCVEEDFEGLNLGNLVSTAWISEASNSSSATSVPCTTTQITYSLNNQQAILVNAPITDTYCNNVGPSPLGGMNILQLNRNNFNTRPSRIRQTFSVTANNAWYHYAYKGVINTVGNHSCCEQPALYFNFYDCNGNIIPALQNAILSASCNTSADAGFWSLSSTGIYATPNWVLKSINLSAYLGSCVTVEVLAVGCIYTGHEGYMYYDALCSTSSAPPGLNVMYANSMIAASYSTCAQPVVLSSVNGMSAYNWQGPSGSGVSNSTLTQVTASISGVYSLTAYSGTTAYTQSLAVTIHSLPTLSIIGPTIYCGTSTVSLQVVTSASSFSWGNGSTATLVVIGPSLSVQGYINAYSAAGCSLNVPYNILADYPSFNTVVASKTLVCPGQSLSLTSQHSGVSILWSNGSTSNSFVITPTVSGLFTASVNSTGGCIKRDSVYITVAPNPTIQVSITNTAVCQFKSLYLTANASLQSTINWSTGDIGIMTFPLMFQSTTITAQATNVFGCIATAICNVTVYPRPEYTLVPPSQTMCEGDAVSFSVTNVSIPASYYWSTGSTSSVTTISPSTGVTVATTLTSSQGCSNSKYLQYTPIQRTASLSILENNKTICLGESVYLNTSYFNIVAMGWSTGDSTASIYVTPTISTTYSLIGQDIYGCKYQDSKIVTVDPCTDLTEHSVNSVLWIFPNPSQEFFEVRSHSQQEIKLFDAQAKLIFSTTLSSDNKYRVLIDKLPAGIYFLKTKNETFKLLKLQ